jgi:hypothetical protein
VCQKEGTQLDLGDQVGFCYGSCSRVTLADLYDLVFQPLERSGGAGEGDETPAPADPGLLPSGQGSVSVLQNVIAGRVELN